jgi:membrane protease YdiL (CAAX protease family)
MIRCLYACTGAIKPGEGDKMSTELTTKQDRLLVYMVVPIAVFLVGAAIIYGTYYSLAAVQPELVASISPGQLTFGIYVLINVVEWVLAISLIRKLRRAGGSVMDLIAPQGDPWRFRWVPAVFVFLGFNGIMAVFMTIVIALLGLSMYEGLHLWQRLLMIVIIPPTAGFCEELIWRGYVITRLEARGRRRWSAISLAALSFAFIHSPIHWPFTFLLGILAGYYYTRERNLLPLMISHTVANLWSFGWSLLLS